MTIENVIQTISPNDWMYKGNRDLEAYLTAGESAASCVQNVLRKIEVEPRNILDFGCGHGRVLRWLAAMYPEAQLTAADRSKDAVEFCSDTFGAKKIISDDEFLNLEVGREFDLIWLGSVYTHLPLRLWNALTEKLSAALSKNGVLAFSIAGPHVAQLFLDGERNPHAEGS